MKRSSAWTRPCQRLRSVQRSDWSGSRALRHSLPAEAAFTPDQIDALKRQGRA